MALPNTNISVAMVKSELGASTNDVGRLCIHPNINPYSRWKPVVNAKVSLLELSDFKAVYTGAESVNNGDYGLRVPDVARTTSSANRDSAIEDASANRWEYRRPAGGSSEPFRLDDFRNYNKDAEPPIQLNRNTNEVLTLGGSAVYLHLGFDLDPADYFTNIHATDIQGLIDLRRCTFYGMIKSYDGNVVKFAESDTILDSDGEINESILSFSGIQDFPQQNTGYEHDIYVVIRNLDYTAGWEFLPLPSSFSGTSYNEFPMKFNINKDPVEDGGGVVDVEYDVLFSPYFGYPYKEAGQAIEEFGGSHKMQNNDGSLLVQMLIKNGSNYSRTFTRNNFTAYNYEKNYNSQLPAYIYDSMPTGAGSSNTSITINAGESKNIWMFFDGLLLGRTGQPVTSFPEISIRRDGIELIGGVLQYSGGLSGWYLL